MFNVVALQGELISDATQRTYISISFSLYLDIWIC